MCYLPLYFLNRGLNGGQVNYKGKGIEIQFRHSSNLTLVYCAININGTRTDLGILSNVPERRDTTFLVR